ncbi:MAG: GntR family transcriptional regulator [Pseudomonadales bacterium]
MSKLSYLVQKATNETLDIIVNNYPGTKLLPNDLSLSKSLGVSRTTVRNVLDQLQSVDIIEKAGTSKKILRKPRKTDYFDLRNEPSSKEELIETFFLDLINTGKLLPGDMFSELDLAKRSGCNTITVREFLIKFSRIGLIKKNPRAQWQMVEFDEKFARELVDFRRILEMSSLSKLLEKTDDDPVWDELQQLLTDHRELLRNPERFQDLPHLDRRLHLAIQSSADNRFIRQFFDIVSFVCHYHYQWQKGDEQERNMVAVEEHIDLITKLLAKDIRGSIMSLENHLNTSRKTLMRSAHGLLE